MCGGGGGGKEVVGERWVDVEAGKIKDLWVGWWKKGRKSARGRQVKMEVKERQGKRGR